MGKRKRRAFTKEFKAETVRIVRDSGKSVGAIARELDLTETALRDWVRQAEIDVPPAEFEKPTMTVGPLQSAWRFSRNELSGKPGAVQQPGPPIS
jgi:transposase-like protein